MSTTDSAVRLLRLLPVLSASSVLMFALDEHIFLGTWTHASLTTSANAHLPAWFTRWGRRGRWVILLGYPTTYLLALANLSIRRPELRMAGSEKWYWLGLMFSVGHIAVFGKGALKLLADIRNDVPKGKSTYSMGVWLRMNWIRALTTDLPAWVCFITAALKTL